MEEKKRLLGQLTSGVGDGEKEEERSQDFLLDGVEGVLCTGSELHL